MRTRVKICGITRDIDAMAALDAGADALGFVFYPQSPRYISPEQARDIVAQLPAFVTAVGLFVDCDAQTVASITDQVGLDLLQFHGAETPAFCAQFTRPYIKALRMHPTIDLSSEVARYTSAKGVLLDAYRPGVPGGTGEVFDWERATDKLALPLILAGGLTAENVAAAISIVNPYAVDVSGGVEAAKGIKSQTKIEAFMREVTSAHR